MSTAELARADEVDGPAPQAVDELVWVSHPLRHAPGKAVFLVAVVAATALVIGLNTGSGAWAALSVIFLVLGVYDFVFPTTFRLTHWGVESGVLGWRRRKPWELLTSAHPEAAGVLLSPFASRVFLEHYRGLYVRFAGNRSAVLSFVRQRLGAAQPARREEAA